MRAKDVMAPKQGKLFQRLPKGDPFHAADDLEDELAQLASDWDTAEKQARDEKRSKKSQLNLPLGFKK